MEQPLSQSPWWWNEAAGEAPLPEPYRARGCEVEATKDRAIRLSQLNQLLAFVQKIVQAVTITDENTYSATRGDRITIEILNMYHLCDVFVKPLTQAFQSSFMELVASEAQSPLWFVSHAWSTKFYETALMLNYHANCHQLETPTYWICTLANNQWDLGELAGGLEQTPFYQAIVSPSCTGVIMTLDAVCTPLTRAWCVLECHTAIKLQEVGEKKFEVVAMIPECSQSRRTSDGQVHWVNPGPVLRMDMGADSYTDWVAPAQGYFPETVADAGVNVSIRQASASVQSDLDSIRRFVADIHDANAAVPDECEAYTRFDSKVRSFFFGPALYNHASRGSLEGVESVLTQAGPTCVAYKNGRSQTALWVAAGFGFSDVVQKLIDEGAEVDSPNVDGLTPLFIASEGGHLPTVGRLLAAGAQVHMTTALGETSLFKAARNGHVDVMALLLGAQADAKTASASGVTAVMIAVEMKHVEAVKILVEAGADVHAVAGGGTTALLLASQQGILENVQVLLGAGADPNSSNANGITPLKMSQYCGHQAIVDALLAAGATMAS